MSNVGVVRLANKLYRSGELDAAVDASCAPDVEWETRWPGEPPVVHGRGAVKEWARRVNEAISFDQEVVDARELDDERVLAEYRLRGAGRGSGVPTEMTVFDLLWFRDGLIYRRRTFYSRDEALEAAGLLE
jgi:ketosteroid isomerase-like protein